MKTWIFLTLTCATLFISEGAPAFAIDQATLEIVLSDGTRKVQRAVLQAQGESDELLCRRVENRLLYLQRLERQAATLREKMISTTLRAVEIELLSSLEARSRTEYEFLQSPAPTRIVTFDLDGMPEDTFKKLESLDFYYHLKSYALEWEGVGSQVEMPPNLASFLVLKTEKKLKLILRASTASYCAREETVLILTF